jgi:hypothetical protein
MPKPVSKIIEELGERLRIGGPVLTILWPKFYELCNMERLKDARNEELKAQARANGMFIVFARNVVVVGYDANFKPMN